MPTSSALTRFIVHAHRLASDGTTLLLTNLGARRWRGPGQPIESDGKTDDADFADEMAVLIARHGYDPARLEVEITETAILSDAAEVRRTMEKLHAIGLRMVADSFMLAGWDVQYLGAESRVRVDLADGAHLLANVPSDGLVGVAVGSDARMAWPRTAAFAVAETNSEGEEQL